MKQKIIKINRSKYGDLYGSVNGRTKYQSSTNTINIGRPKGSFSVQVKVKFPYGVIEVIRGSEPILSTLDGCSGLFDTGAVSYPYIPNLQMNFIKFGSFIKNHWKEGLTIGSTVWTFFREFGILAFPTTRFFKL